MADEVGFMMNPSVKKTWAPEACTPVVPFRNRRHKKVSVLGAVVLHSRRCPCGARASAGARGQHKQRWWCDFHPDSYVRAAQAAAFVHRILAEYPTGPLDLVWDNLNAHRSKLVKELLIDHPRLRFHYLPPYAPDLNAAEGVWCQTKYHRMANHSIDDLNALHAEAKRHLDDLSQQQHLLQACFKEAELAL